MFGCGQKQYGVKTLYSETVLQAIRLVSSEAVTAKKSSLVVFKKKHDKKFDVEYSKIINQFTLEFSKNYCSSKGEILWEKKLFNLIRRNSL